MTYPQAQGYLNSFVNYERSNLYPYKFSFNLARMQRLSQPLGCPHRALRIIHIAGSKGKGSTCAFVANILKEAGFKVGLYTSPHLVDIRERIRILQRTNCKLHTAKREKISRKDFARAIEKIRPYADKLRVTNLGRLSYYEILTTSAFLYFRKEKCDFVVLETGLGGRLDATNVVSSLICAITPISYEHTGLLGKTLAEIAEEKAQIIKDRITNLGINRQIVITALQGPEVVKVIRRRVKRCRVVLYELGKDIRIIEESLTGYGQSFSLQGICTQYDALKIGLLGRHQIVNAAVAVGCVESLRHYDFNISQQAIRQGLKKTRWPGRLQIISRKPQIILDGAQNQASALALREALDKLFKFRHLILVFGVSQNKDVGGILSQLLPLASRIILTKAQNPRALEPALITKFIKADKIAVTLTNNSTQALKKACQSAGPKDLILVCGSLFLVGEILKSRDGSA